MLASKHQVHCPKTLSVSLISSIAISQPYSQHPPATGMEAPIVKKNYPLFGHPISHSVSPLFHNFIWTKLDPCRRYVLCETSSTGMPGIVERIRSEIDQGTFGGAGVTMPWKTQIIDSGLLDCLAPAARAIGSVNTIYPTAGGLVGDNTDWLGIHNALGVGRQEQPCAGFIIGSGATARSAAYSLNELGVSPIYLINRDYDEMLNLIGQFPHLDIRAITDLEDLAAERTGRYVRPIRLAVGCIPSDQPQTEAEELVHQLAHRLFADQNRHEEAVFLEMTYRPRQTPMLSRASQAGWKTVEGIQAMIEQGLAQSKIWLENPAPLSKSDEMQASMTAENKKTEVRIPAQLESEIREYILNMDDLC